MRIGFICQPGTANSHYRSLVPMTELEQRGHTIFWPGRHSYADALAGKPPWDLLHIHQFINDENLAVVRRLRKQGVAVVWDSDDDILNIPKGTESYRRYGGRRKLKRLHAQTVEMAREAHLMTTTNEHLAEIYRAEGVANVVVVPNYLARERPVLLPRRRHGTVVGIVAAIEHTPDVKELRIASALEAIQRKHPGVSVVALGVDLGLKERYRHDRRVPFEQLYQRVREFDIGLAPLTDSRFNRSRSNVKLKEYASNGVAWLASPVGPYAEMGEREGGLAVQDGDWFDALDALVTDVHRRHQLVKRGTAWASTQTIRHAGGRWEAAFRDAIIRARRTTQPRAGAR